MTLNGDINQALSVISTMVTCVKGMEAVMSNINFLADVYKVLEETVKSNYNLFFLHHVTSISSCCPRITLNRPVNFPSFIELFYMLYFTNSVTRIHVTIQIDNLQKFISKN